MLSLKVVDFDLLQICTARWTVSTLHCGMKRDSGVNRYTLTLATCRWRRSEYLLVLKICGKVSHNLYSIESCQIYDHVTESFEEDPDSVSQRDETQNAAYEELGLETTECNQYGQ